jgi:hypothetical protein
MPREEQPTPVQIHAISMAMAGDILRQLLPNQSIIQTAEIWVDGAPFWRVEMKEGGEMVIR